MILFLLGWLIFKGELLNFQAVNLPTHDLDLLPPKIAIDWYCSIPPQMGNLMTPGLSPRKKKSTKNTTPRRPFLGLRTVLNPGIEPCRGRATRQRLLGAKFRGARITLKN